MTITLNDLLQGLGVSVLPSKYAPDELNDIILDKIIFSDYFNDETYKSFVKCVLSAYVEPEEYERKIQVINYFLQTNNINKNINKKKLLTLIKKNTINNEVVLFLSAYFECNIWVYYKENRIFKLYYVEKHLDRFKDNIFISYGFVQDTVQKSFQLGYLDKTRRFKFHDDIVTDVMSNYIVIPIGLQENKSLTIGEGQCNPLYEEIEVSAPVVGRGGDVFNTKFAMRIEDKEHLQDFIDNFDPLNLYEEINRLFKLKYENKIKG